MEKDLQRKKTRLFIGLSALFLTNAILAELIGVKIFSAEETVGLSPANMNILGFQMDFNLTAGVLIWPVVFITTDLINEYFGKTGVRRISVLTAALIAYSFLVIFIAMELSPAAFWIEANQTDSSGNTFNVDYAFRTIFGQGLRIIGGSLTAFLLAQLIDVFVFQRLRHVTGSKMLWLRATGSTLVSQLIDSFVVLYIAFYGIFPHAQLIAIGITNYIYKFAVAILLTPVIYLGHELIDRYLGKENARKIAEEATIKSQRFI